MRVYGGVEGGATCSKAILINEAGRVLSIIEDGPGLNIWLEGYDSTYQRINELINRAKARADMDVDLPLESLGICASGFEGNDELLKPFADAICIKYPNLARTLRFKSDTVGSILTVTKRGGIVVISGTGSNSMLLNPNGETHTCGGLGHVLGDEGSAFWIVKTVIVSIIHHDQHFKVSELDVEPAKRILYEYFKISKMDEIIERVYNNFKKSYFAGACLSLSKGALYGDPFLKKIFYEAGFCLGQHVAALTPKVDKSLLEEADGLTVACVGSVFKSWPLIRNGFIDGLQKTLTKCTLYTMTDHSSIGAAIFGSKYTENQLNLDLELFRTKLDQLVLS